MGKKTDPTILQIRKQLQQLGDPEIAAHSQRFFKTGPGEYGEGDQFVGVRVPALRKMAKQYRDIPLVTAEALLASPIHEMRLMVLYLLVLKFQRGDDGVRKEVFDTYWSNLQYVNNWDLVDGSAHYIVGGYLRDRSRQRLYRLAKSRDLWRRRIAMMSTFAYIKQDDFADTLQIAEMLLNDDEDLIHKAVGWMLREIGNRDCATEEDFLAKHYRAMPRTMLRYAIEKFPESKRKRYLAGKV